jgi:RNA polymerase sigma-70 factor (ECF subfamily)
VSRFIVGALRKGPQSFSVSLVDVNGWPAIVVRDGERVHSITDIETDGEVIFAVRSVLNPDKLRRVA